MFDGSLGHEKQPPLSGGVSSTKGRFILRDLSSGLSIAKKGSTTSPHTKAPVSPLFLSTAVTTTPTKATPNTLNNVSNKSLDEEAPPQRNGHILVDEVTTPTTAAEEHSDDRSSVCSSSKNNDRTSPAWPPWARCLVCWDDRTEDPITFYGSKEFIVLPCFHLVCKDGSCVERLFGVDDKGTNEVAPGKLDGRKGSCPTCRRVVTHSVEALSTIVRPMEYLNGEKEPEKVVQICTLCIRGGKAMGFCNDCSKYLCNVCTENHPFGINSKDHSLNVFAPNDEHFVSSTESIKCQNHPNTESTIYCRTCESVICVSCLSSHSLHQTYSMEEGIDLLHKDVVEYEDQLHKCMEDMGNLGLKVTQRMKDIANTEKRRLIAEIQTALTAIMERILAIANDLRREVKQKTSEKIEVIRAKELQCTTTIKSVFQYAQFLRSLKKSKGKSAVMFIQGCRLAKMHFPEQMKLVSQHSGTNAEEFFGLHQVLQVDTSSVRELKQKIREFGKILPREESESQIDSTSVSTLVTSPVIPAADTNNRLCIGASSNVDVTSNETGDDVEACMISVPRSRSRNTGMRRNQVEDSSIPLLYPSVKQSSRKSTSKKNKNTSSASPEIPSSSDRMSTRRSPTRAGIVQSPQKSLQSKRLRKYKSMEASQTEKEPKSEDDTSTRPLRTRRRRANSTEDDTNSSMECMADDGDRLLELEEDFPQSVSRSFSGGATNIAKSVRSSNATSRPLNHVEGSGIRNSATDVSLSIPSSNILHGPVAIPIPIPIKKEPYLVDEGYVKELHNPKTQTAEKILAKKSGRKSQLEVRTDTTITFESSPGEFDSPLPNVKEKRKKSRNSAPSRHGSNVSTSKRAIKRKSLGPGFISSDDIQNDIYKPDERQSLELELSQRKRSKVNTPGKKKVAKKPPQITNDPLKTTEDSDHEDYCCICRDGGDDLLCCDLCPKIFHPGCHIPALSAIPEGSFHCNLCKAKDEACDPEKQEENHVRNKTGIQKDTKEFYKACKFISEIFRIENDLQFRVVVDNIKSEKLKEDSYSPSPLFQIKERLAKCLPTPYNDAKEVLDDLFKVLRDYLAKLHMGQKGAEPVQQFQVRLKPLVQLYYPEYFRDFYPN